MDYFLEINMDNAAFEDPGYELSRLLRKAADRVEQYSFEHEKTTFPIMDINGNKVGIHGYKES